MYVYEVIVNIYGWYNSDHTYIHATCNSQGAQELVFISGLGPYKNKALAAIGRGENFTFTWEARGGNSYVDFKRVNID